MTDNLLLESKYEDKKQQMETAEEDVFKDIKDVWMEKKSKKSSQQTKNECAKLQQRKDFRQVVEAKGFHEKAETNSMIKELWKLMMRQSRWRQLTV